MSSYVVRKSPGDTEWFRMSRFGMFIHWGLYAMPARHEWIKTREMIPEAKYDKYFKYFNPDMYDPAEWARQAKAAGMKYVVNGAKRTPGTCLAESPAELRQMFEDSDLIIAKGQGNFETLNECSYPVAFLFMAKCPVVTRLLDVEVNSLQVLLHW